MEGFQQFIRERQCLRNVSISTLDWYKNGFKHLRSERPTQAELNDAVMRMREKGLKATGCNSAIRALNCYLKWTGSHLRVPLMREPQTILPTFTTAQVERLVGWKAKTRCQRRLHLLVLLLLDTGCRISEALALHVADIDFQNMLVLLDGKGRKQRLVPFSFELRKKLFRYITDFGRKPDALLLASRNETRLGRRVMLRDVKLLCKRLDFTPPARTLHAFRHTFGANYIRRGGSVFHLQKVLGHSTLDMTRRYANLVTADLSAVHERLSLLAR
jgi:integrase/recombinase XerD